MGQSPRLPGSDMADGADDLSGDSLRPGIEIVDIASDHHCDDVVYPGPAADSLADTFTIAQHGKAVGNFLDLLQEV